MGYFCLVSHRSTKQADWEPERLLPSLCGWPSQSLTCSRQPLTRPCSETPRKVALQASPVLCSLRRRRNCPTALDINPYLFLIFPFYQRWKGEGESHCWLWNVPGSFAVAAKKQVSRRSVWAKIRGSGLGRPLVLWLRCWRALTSRSVGLFEGHVRRDVLWAPGEACHRRTDNKWEANVVPKMADFRVPVGCLPQTP